MKVTWRPGLISLIKVQDVVLWGSELIEDAEEAVRTQACETCWWVIGGGYAALLLSEKVLIC